MGILCASSPSSVPFWVAPSIRGNPSFLIPAYSYEYLSPFLQLRTIASYRYPCRVENARKGPLTLRATSAIEGFPVPDWERSSGRYPFRRHRRSVCAPATGCTLCTTSFTDVFIAHIYPSLNSAPSPGGWDHLGFTPRLSRPRPIRPDWILYTDSASALPNFAPSFDMEVGDRPILTPSMQLGRRYHGHTCSAIPA